MNKLKVGVALSGGVDSTSTALMLRQEYNVTAFFMQLAQPDLFSQTEKVTGIAKKIGIPLKIIDLQKDFEQHVLQYFCTTYFTGLTPNPCMICNREIKFGLFLDAILANGMDMAATGHYARVYKKANLFHLAKGRDTKKDQSYFLARLSQKQLSKILFPLGDKEKEEIFTFAEQQGFHSFRGTESQDVCFLENTSVSEYLQDKYKGVTASGPIIDQKGNILGNHNGIFNYTVGQRRGLGISAPNPLYVTAIDSKHNAVIVGSNEDLLQKNVTLTQLHWIAGPQPDFTRQYTVKIRYTHKGSLAYLAPEDDGTLTLSFTEPQRAVTPGQYAVIYDQDEVIGSGEII